MKIIKVAYMPDLSDDAIELIVENITYSMISNDETSQQFEIGQVLELLEEYKYKYDVDLIEDLVDQDVAFIEL